MVDIAHMNLVAPPDKLPVWKTVKQTYAAFFENFGTLLKISVPWLLLVGVLSYFSFSILGSLWPTMGDASRPEPPLPQSLFLLQAIHGALNLLTMLAGATMAVAWHRLLLLGEQPTLGGNFLTSTVWRYLGAGIAMFVVAMLPAGLFILPALLFLGPFSQTHQAEPGVIFFAFFFAAYIAAIYLMINLMLVLPARAVGDKNLNFRSILKRTKGNTWRLIGGMFLCALPPAIPAQFALFHFLPFREKGQTIDPAAMMANLSVLLGVLTPYLMLVTMIFIGFLSYAYQHFFEKT